MTIKELKKELRITDVTIAQWFGYANVQSYRNSSGKPKIEAGLIKIYTAYELIPKERRIVSPDSRLEDLDLSVRLHNALMMAFKERKTTLAQISEYTAREILCMEGIGKAGLKELQNLCSDAGINLSTK
jgi:DNA-directed RNA polymerase alpha subunit